MNKKNGTNLKVVGALQFTWYMGIVCLLLYNNFQPADK